MGEFKGVLWYILMPVLLICMLILPANFSTASLVFVNGLVLMFIAKINLKSSIPVIFCVLMDENIKQSIERSGGKIGNKGVDAAYTSLKMMELNKS